MIHVSELVKTYGEVTAVADDWDDRDRRTRSFLTTHYMDEAERVARRIAIIDRGKIVAQGSAADLKGRHKPNHSKPPSSP